MQLRDILVRLLKGAHHWMAVMLVIGLALLLAPVTMSQGTTLHVDAVAGIVNPGDPCPMPRDSAVYKTIQKAINCAVAGDTIDVTAGTYSENVNINKALSLRGANAGIDARTPRGPETIVDGGAISAPFAINANSVTIDGFKIRAGQNGLGAGIWMGVVSDIQILNNIITDNTIGLFAHGCPCTIRHNLFDANNRSGPAGATGLYTEATNGLVIDENEFKNHTINTTVNFASVTAPSHFNVVFTNNSIHGNRLGTHALAISGGTFRGNTYASNGIWGLMLNGGNSNIDVVENTFVANPTGVRISSDYTFGANSNVRVNLNRFIGNTVGIVVNRVGYVGALNAENNWWGCNYGPSAGGSGCTSVSNSTGVAGSVDANPWLTLRLAPIPQTIPAAGGTSTLTAFLTFNSANTDTSSLGHIPNGVAASFSATLGGVAPTTAGTSAGLATSTFTAGPAVGTANVSVKVDNQTVANTVMIVPATVDLKLAKTDGGLASTPGGVIPYTLTYTNMGNTAASGVVVTETVPAHASFNAAASLPTVWSCAHGSPAGSVCTHALGSVPGGNGTGAVTFAVTVIRPLPLGVTTLTITNTARIGDDGSHGPDPAADNVATDTTPVTGPAPIYLPLILRN